MRFIDEVKLKTGDVINIAYHKMGKPIELYSMIVLDDATDPNIRNTFLIVKDAAGTKVYIWEGYYIRHEMVKGEE